MAGATAALAASVVHSGATTVPRPNVILILTDDQRYLDIYGAEGSGKPVHMPILKAKMRQQGMNFTRHFTPFSLCAPSRVGILTGLYPQNHGIQINTLAYDAYVNAGYPATALPAAAQAAGVYTGFVGKFLNDEMDTDVPPAGFDKCHAFVNSFMKWYHFEMMDETGTVTKYWNGEYATDTMTSQCLDFIANAPMDRPFMLMYSPNATHGPNTAFPSDVGTFDPNDMPITAAFNVQIVNGKPQVQMTDAQIADTKTVWASRLDCAQSLDRSIGAIIDALTASGQIDNTYIFFTTDNGFMLGEHRVTEAKGNLFDESTHLPLIVRGPGVAVGNNSAFLSNIDITATIADLLGVTMSYALDGRSFVPQLNGTAGAWDKAVLIGCRFGWGIASLNYRYMESGWGVELYDVNADPMCLVNVAGQTAYAAAQAACAADLAILKACSGTSCQVTGTLPAPPPRH